MFPFKRKQNKNKQLTGEKERIKVMGKPSPRSHAGRRACWGLRAQEEPFKRWGSAVRFPRVKEGGKRRKAPRERVR